MIFLTPFKDQSAAGQSGNMLIITGLIASAVAVAGGKVMLDRSSAQRKANQMAESAKQAKEIPGSAAMIAKALISIPPNVAANKSIEWTTNKLVTSPGNMPLVYPVPYVSGAIGSPAMPATSVSQTVTPPPGANWDTFGVAGTTLAVGGVFASAEVNVYTNDSTRATSQDVNSAISGQAVTGGNATVARTKSVVTYSFRNCTPNGISSATFTGRYCATASIKSPNYASAVKRTLKDQDLSKNPPPNLNEGVAELGLIEAPPKPVCGTISTPGNAKVKSGNAFSLDVKATGVAVGYNVRLISPSVAPSTLATSGNTPIRLSLDHPRLERVHTISGIPTSDPSVKAALDQAGVSAMTLSVDLTAIDGSVTPCDVTVQLDKPIVACESGSFAVSRTGADKRTCSISLRKDNGMGAVKQVRIVQTNATTGTATTSNLAASFSANNWSSSVPCSQDGWTFNAFLTREYPIGTAISDSQCSPQQIVAELPPDCDAVSSQNENPARVAPPPISNLLKCSVKVVRTPASHSGAGVWIDGADQTSSGTWASNVWTGVVPCAAGAITMSAALKKDSTSSSCWTRPISATDPALCVSNSTRAYRTAGNNSECYVTLTKNALSTPYFDIKVNGNIYAGTWTANNWRSANFACNLDQNSYKATLTGVDGVPSDCGTFILPAIPPVCSNLTASRQSPTSTTCDVTVTKGASGGPVSSAVVNGKIISSVDQTTYNTQVPCSIEGETITGLLSNSSGAASCPSFIVSSSLCSSAPSFIDFTIEGSAAAVSSTIDSAQRSCYNYVSAVCVGGGGGGRSVNNDDDNGGGGGALAWFANRPLVNTDAYTASGGALGAYGQPGGSSSVKVNGKFIINAGGGGSNNSAGGTRQIPTTVAGSTTWMGLEAIAGVTYGGGNGGGGGSAKQVGGWLSPGGGGGAGGYSGDGGKGANGERGNGTAGGAGGGGGGGGGTGCDGAGKGGGVILYGKGATGAGGGYSGKCKKKEYGAPGGAGSNLGTSKVYGGGSGGPAENNAWRYSDPGACRVVFSKEKWNWLIQN